jgi:hypothetical protein
MIDELKVKAEAEFCKAFESLLTIELIFKKRVRGSIHHQQSHWRTVQPPWELQRLQRNGARVDAQQYVRSATDHIHAPKGRVFISERAS